MLKKGENLPEKIEKLEKQRIAYLEADQNAYANKIGRQIRTLQEKIEILELRRLKYELKLYKKVFRKYIFLQTELEKERQKMKKEDAYEKEMCNL